MKQIKEYSMLTTSNYIEMLSYMRPEGSVAQRKFCNRFLLPVFGRPDPMGNYILKIGNPTVAFMSHHDTVHNNSGMQKVAVDSGGFATATEDCLGADCTTGVYIMLRMIEAGVEGLYIVHTAEEVGCRGSGYIVQNTPEVVYGIQSAISFDRYGYDSIITHQSGRRTCSNKFADSLADILNLNYSQDEYGSYTDSNEYRTLIPECTNLSVGYFKQHTSKESQDLRFMEVVADACIEADWEALVIHRDPKDSGPSWDIFDSVYDDPYCDDTEDDEDFEMLIAENPKSVAALLKAKGYDLQELKHDLRYIRTDNY